MPIPQTGVVVEIREHKMKDVVPERRNPRPHAPQEDPPPTVDLSLEEPPSDLKDAPRAFRQMSGQRTEAIIADLGTSMSLAEIAAKHGCSRQRVHQIKRRHLQRP